MVKISKIHVFFIFLNEKGVDCTKKKMFRETPVSWVVWRRRLKVILAKDDSDFHPLFSPTVVD